MHCTRPLALFGAAALLTTLACSAEDESELSLLDDELALSEDEEIDEDDALEANDELVAPTDPAALGGSCPGIYDSYGCSVSGSSVCVHQSNGWSADTYDCSLAQGGSGGGNLTIVEGYAANNVISAWGTAVDSGGVTRYFCCSHTMQDDDYDITLEGSGYADTISLTYGSHDLSEGFPTNVVHALVVAGGGADTIYGSDAATGWYREWLYGERGSDTIEANDGATDYLMGCGTQTTCFSSDYDVLKGNEGVDMIYCDQNACEARGGDGNDTVVGSEDDDHLRGGANDDKLCANGGSDLLEGGNGNDFQYGGAGADTNVGGGGSDSCRSPQGDCESLAPVGQPIGCTAEPSAPF